MIRYLSEAEVEPRGRASARGSTWRAWRSIALAEGHAELPPKSSVRPRTGAFANVMPAYLEDVGHGDQLGLKWVAVYNTNAARGLPIINGVVVICDTDTGLPRALMAAGFSDRHPHRRGLRRLHGGARAGRGRPRRDHRRGRADALAPARSARSSGTST